MTEGKSVLVSWIGGNDLNAVERDQHGPLLSTLLHTKFRRAELIYNYPDEQVKPYLDRIKDTLDIPISAKRVNLSSPINYGEIYEVSLAHLAGIHSNSEPIAILLSPGTPAMQAVWVLLGKTRFPASFYQSTLEQGTQQIELPFEIAAEYLPAAAQLTSSQITRLSGSEAPLDAAFDDIITRNPTMLRLKGQAQILAKRDVPVLLYGETGTGKELFAKAIHNASQRKDAPLVVLNCGAIPPELIDSELFGHRKGAFTGAVADRKGVFERANGGTLFLDEFGELEPSVQVRLLRVLQDGCFTSVGAAKETNVDVRIIAATNRNLMHEVAEGRFREDLFYRIAVGVLHLPPLRQREGDLLLLADNLLSILAEQDPSLKGKIISTSAKNLIISQRWRGNVRELRSTLLRAALWSQQDSLTADDITQALFDFPAEQTETPPINLDQNIDIHSIISETISPYINHALTIAGQNKSKAASLLGLNNPQTLRNWMKKYGVG